MFFPLIIPFFHKWSIQTNSTKWVMTKFCWTIILFSKTGTGGNHCIDSWCVWHIHVVLHYFLVQKIFTGIGKHMTCTIFSILLLKHFVITKAKCTIHCGLAITNVFVGELALFRYTFHSLIWHHCQSLIKILHL